MTRLMVGKAGLVTGAGSGIGRAGALLFAENGAHVIVSDISSDAGEETVQMIRDNGGEASFVACDVSDEAQVQALVAATHETFGAIDFAFNNAGYNSFSKIADTDSSSWDRVMKINLYGTFYCLKHEVIAMRERNGGAIVNTASGSGLTGNNGTASYNAAKFGVVGLTRNVAMDYAQDNIRVNAIAPGATATPMMLMAFESNPGPEFEESVYGGIPMRKLAEPEDQGSAAVWLCSDQAKMITGVTLPVDGGYLAGK